MLLPLQVGRLPEVSVLFRSDSVSKAQFSSPDEDYADGSSARCYYFYHRKGTLYYERCGNPSAPIWFDVQFSDEVLLLLRLETGSSASQYFTHIASFSSLDSLSSCPNFTRLTGIPELGGLQCPSVFQLLFTAPWTESRTELILRARRLIVWTSNVKSADLFAHMQILGVYDGLAVSPKEAEAYDLPTQHYYSAPESADFRIYVTNKVQNTKPVGGLVGQKAEVREAVLQYNTPGPFNARQNNVYSYFGLTDVGLSWFTTQGWGTALSELEFGREHLVVLHSSFMKMTSPPGRTGYAHVLAPADVHGIRQLRTSLYANINRGNGAEAIGYAELLRYFGNVQSGWIGHSSVLYFLS